MNITQKYDHHISINVTYITFILPSPGPGARAGVTFVDATTQNMYLHLQSLISKIVFFFLKHDGPKV